MKVLFSEFTFLSDEDLMKLFEIEAYKAWTNLGLESQNEVDYMEESEDYQDSIMESTMTEF
ncbi:hypothetical protein ACS0TY_023507 [Phlomoides rotata]